MNYLYVEFVVKASDGNDTRIRPKDADLDY